MKTENKIQTSQRSIGYILTTNLSWPKKYVITAKPMINSIMYKTYDDALASAKRFLELSSKNEDVTASYNIVQICKYGEWYECFNFYDDKTDQQGDNI